MERIEFSSFKENVKKKDIKIFKSFFSMAFFVCLTMFVVLGALGVTLNKSYAESLKNTASNLGLSITEDLKISEDENLKTEDFQTDKNKENENKVQQTGILKDLAEDLGIIEKEPKYMELKNEMIYIAVYYITEMPKSGSAKWKITPHYAPQNSTKFQDADYVSEYYENSPTVCSLYYANNYYYAYGDSAFGHYRERIYYGLFNEKDVPVPQISILKADEGYKYIGYNFYQIKDWKLAANKQLPHAECLNDVNNTVLQSNETKLREDWTQYNYLYSIYFYAPAKIEIESVNSDYGRFSTKPNAVFHASNTKINILNIQMGYNYELIRNPNDNLFLKISGTYHYIEDGKAKTRDISYQYYYILKDHCQLADTNFKNEKGTIKKSETRVIKLDFTHQVFDLTFNIVTNVTNIENLTLFTGFRYLTVRPIITAGENQITTVKIEDIPAGLSDWVSVSIYSSDKTKYYTITNEPITEFERSDKFQDIAGMNKEITIDNEDVIVTENYFYITEIFKVKFDNRTGEEPSFAYKVNNVDYRISYLSSDFEINGFNFCGFSLDEDSLEKVEILTENKETTIYMNLSKELSVSFYHEDSEVRGREDYTSTIYNFDTTRTFVIEDFEKRLAENLVGYTKTINDTKNIINAGNGITVTDGDKFYAVYKYSYSLEYNYQNLIDTDMFTMVGEIPKNYSTEVLKTVFGETEQIQLEIPNTSFEKEHYEFVGWHIYNSEYNKQTDYYTAGEKIIVNLSQLVLYPIKKDVIYTMKINLNGGRYVEPTSWKLYTEIYDETSNTLTVLMKHSDVYRFYSNVIVKDGYKIKNVSAEISPENLYKSSPYYYTDIDKQEIINIEWELDRYTVSVRLKILTPVYEDSVTVNYSYFDIILNEQITGSKVLTNGFSGALVLDLKVPMGTKIDYIATTNVENANLAFIERNGTVNKSCTYSIVSTSENKTIPLFLATFVKINLIQKGITNGNENEVMYKYYYEEMRLPLDSIGTRDGYEFSHWSSYEDGSNTLTKINANINYEFNVYAIWKKYIKFYIGDKTTPKATILESNRPYSLEIGDTYTAYSLGVLEYQEINGEKYKILGFTTNPNSIETEYFYAETRTFSNSISWYAVLNRYDLTKVVEEDITAVFKVDGEIVSSQDTKRYITYTNFPIYYNYDLSIEDWRYTSGSKNYSSDKIEFVYGTKDNYIIYGWNNTGFARDGYITEDDEFIIGEEIIFHPIYRDGVQKITLTHKFHFNGTRETTRESYAYGLLNIFKVYNTDLSGGIQISDEKDYPLTYDKMMFDKINSLNPHIHNMRYELLGWSTSPYGYNPSWSEGEIEVTGETEWYAVWQYTTEKVERVELTHKFVLDEEKSVSFKTTRIDYVKGITEKYSYKRDIVINVSNGYIERSEGSNLNYYTMDSFTNNHGLFEGWSTIKDSTNIIFDFNNRDEFKPLEALTLYPVFSEYFDFELIYKIEGLEDIIKEKSEKVYYNFEQTVFTLNSKGESEVLEIQVEDNLFDDGGRLLGWFSFDNEETLYLAGDKIVFNEFSKENRKILIAKLKQPEVKKVTFVIDDEISEINYLEGDEVELEDLELIDGYVLSHWTDNENNYNIGEKIIVTSDLKLTAVYMTEEEYNNMLNNNKNEKIDDKKSNTVLIVVIIAISVVLVSGVVVVVFVLKKKNAKITKK